MEARTPAWDLALFAAARSGVTIASLRELEDADRIRRIIDEVWGAQVLPRELLRAFQHAGCVLFGASAEGELVGFVLGFPGLEGGLHLHSHMLAVLPGNESRGIGFALKLAQRAACLDAGIEDVRWTYDPLISRNARFNLGRLGAVAVALLPVFYGEMTDRLNLGDRSDRFEVRWALMSERVRAVVEREPNDTMETTSGVSILEACGDARSPRPADTGEAPAPGRPALVAVPPDYAGLRARDPELARDWREASARAFGACFWAGLVATAITPQGQYLFQPGPAAGRGWE